MRNRREFQIRLFLVIATCLVLSILGACRGDDENLVGPCYHEYKSAILEIEDARASGSNEQITTFRISSVTLNGHNYDLASLVGEQSFGIVLQGGELICRYTRPSRTVHVILCRLAEEVLYVYEPARNQSTFTYS